MNKQTYLMQLEKYLEKLPEKERQDVLQYYEEYFQESEDSEEEIIKALGSPAKVANTVLAESKIEAMETMEPSAKRSFSMITTVLLLIFAAPIAIPIAVVLALVFLAAVLLVVGTILLFGLLGVVAAVTGIVLVIVSITAATTHITSALFGIGCGLMALGLGVLLAIGAFYLMRAIFSFVYRQINKRSRKGVA